MLNSQILTPSLNPLSDFTHIKSLFRQMRLFEYSSTCICSYLEHRTPQIRKEENYLNTEGVWGCGYNIHKFIYMNIYKYRYFI